MEHKIQELTDKMYREGVERGIEESERLIAQAREEAGKIIADAEKEAAAVLAAARKSADELAANTRSELRLYAVQAVQALKSEIATVITDRIVTEWVTDFTAHEDFFPEFIRALASKWSASEPIVISTGNAEALRAYFMLRAKTLMDMGVQIEQVNGLKADFTVGPEDGSYVVRFGAEEFMNYFMAMLRPQLVEMLF
jgi:V/A-type H+-transporting ATPase subunit E